ncbi:MAG TPA: phosphatase PAP2 family protein [Acidimicrobiales bacterium]|nr:phosphatase PAP2 family protein [Acidimicrobiales bacterium]
MLLAAVLVLAGSVLEAAAADTDEALTEDLAGRGGRAVELVTLTVSQSGDITGVVLVVVVAAVVSRHRRRWRDLAFVGVALTLELTVFMAVATAVGRDRPPVPAADAPPATGSFPSGHAAAAMVGFGALAALVPVGRPQARRAAQVIAGLAAVGVGLSRLARGHHRISEVVAGLVLGSVVLAAIHAVARRDGWSPRDPPEASPEREGRYRAADMAQVRDED